MIKNLKEVRESYVDVWRKSDLGRRNSRYKDFGLGMYLVGLRVMKEFSVVWYGE